MSQAAGPNANSTIEEQAREVFRQKQQAFHDALKARDSIYAKTAAYNLESFAKDSVAVTCSLLTVAEPFIWGTTSAQIQYPDGTKLSFYGTGWGIGFGAGAGGGGGPATSQSSNLLGDTPFEVEFTAIQVVAVYYKADGVVCTLICPGAFPGAGYLKGVGTWKYGW